MSNELQELQELRAKLDERQRRLETMQIREAVARRGVRNVETVAKIILASIGRDEEGELVGLDEAADRFVRENPEFRGGQSSGGPEVQLEDIKPGASKKVLEAARKKINENLKEMGITTNLL